MRPTTTTARPEPVQKGKYCIDHDVNYEDGDEFRSINNVGSVESCRQECLSETECQFYVWKGFSRSKTCHLKASGFWVPEYESGTVSGKLFSKLLRFCHAKMIKGLISKLILAL